MSVTATSKTAYSFPRTTPESEGISSNAIARFIEAVEQHEHPLQALHSFMLLRHGHVVAEGWWEPYRPEFPHMLYSLSKSFASSAIGIAVDEGLLSVDDPVLKFFPDDAPENPSDNLKAMTVKHLLSMNTGHHEDTTGAVWGGTDDNWPRAFLAQPVQHEPGTWFVYNTAATYMLSAIITQLTGEFLIDYLRPRLFDPLGIEQPTWDVDPHGRSIGGSGLHITTDAIARFGQLYLQRGEWEGERIISEAWIDTATAAHSDNSNTQTNPDWTVGYGYQFWRCRHGAYRGDGASGQYCVVFPEQDAVLAITSGLRDMQAILDRVWEHLLPAFEAGALPEDAAAQTALEQKLASLSLPVVPGATTSAITSAVSGSSYRLEPNDFGIERVRFVFDDDSATVTTIDARGEHPIRAGYGSWIAGRSDSRGSAMERIGASGAWTANDTFELRTCYTEGEVCITARTRFLDGGVSFEVDPNVSWGEPLVTVIAGQIDPRGAE